MEKIILILGGTGTLGWPSANALKAAGFRVRIMTRDLQKAQKKFDNTFELVVGEPIDIASLVKAMNGCYGIHISLPEVEQQVAEAVSKLAARHGVERITYLSGATVAKENRWFPMINHKYLAEKAITESGIPYTILCPTWVMEMLPMFINQGRAAVFGKQPCPYHWVAADDIAKMVLKAYQLDGAANTRFIVHGPEAIRIQDALMRYCAAFYPEIKQVSSMPFWSVKLLATLTKDPGLKGAGELMAYFEKVGEGSMLPQVDCRLGAPTISLDEWLQKSKSGLPRFQ